MPRKILSYKVFYALADIENLMSKGASPKGYGEATFRPNSPHNNYTLIQYNTLSAIHRELPRMSHHHPQCRGQYSTCIGIQQDLSGMGCNTNFLTSFVNQQVHFLQVIPYWAQFIMHLPLPMAHALATGHPFFSGVGCINNYHLLTKGGNECLYENMLFSLFWASKKLHRTSS